MLRKIIKRAKLNKKASTKKPSCPKNCRKIAPAQRANKQSIIRDPGRSSKSNCKDK